MGEMRPHVSKRSLLVLLLGVLITGTPETTTALCAPDLFDAGGPQLGFYRLIAASGPPTVRYLELHRTGGFQSLRKDADGREDEEEGNDEIDIILMPSPAPDGVETVDTLVRVRRPGILLVDSEVAPLEASLESIPSRSPSWAAKVIRTADGGLAAELWPGDYRLRLDHPESPPPAPTLRFSFFDPCSQDRSETEPGLLLCAQPLAPGDTVAGTLAAGESSLFTLVLTAWRTVEIATGGVLDTTGELFDRSGHRLAAADSGGDGANFKISKSLGPGRYFVRVEGRGPADGSYVLSYKHTAR